MSPAKIVIGAAQGLVYFLFPSVHMYIVRFWRGSFGCVFEFCTNFTMDPVEFCLSVLLINVEIGIGSYIDSGIPISMINWHMLGKNGARAQVVDF